MSATALCGSHPVDDLRVGAEPAEAETGPRDLAHRAGDEAVAAGVVLVEGREVSTVEPEVGGDAILHRRDPVPSDQFGDGCHPLGREPGTGRVLVLWVERHQSRSVPVDLGCEIVDDQPVTIQRRPARTGRPSDATASISPGQVSSSPRTDVSRAHEHGDGERDRLLRTAR